MWLLPTRIRSYPYFDFSDLVKVVIGLKKKVPKISHIYSNELIPTKKFLFGKMTEKYIL